MRRIVILGGTGGLGRAMADALLLRGDRVVALGREEPEGLEFTRFNMLSDDWSVLEEALTDADALIVTAGAGRVAPFDALTDAEVSRAFRLNAEGVALALHRAFPSLKEKKDFYCAVLGSIAGLLPSPLMAAYAAAKAAVEKLVDSLNAELEDAGSPNRILGVYPGYFGGTGFDGKKENREPVRPLAEEILKKMWARETRFIPLYDEVYRDVLERCQRDPRAFALQSIEYKRASGRVGGGNLGRIGFLSGTFDLFHIGHLNLLRRAKQRCDHLVVGVHPATSRHKDKPVYIPLEERMEIVAACKYVDEVVVTLDEDDQMHELIHYDLLFVGSDYKGTERFNRYERELTPLGVKIIYFSYTEGTSSTQLRRAIDGGGRK
ncbi:MAG: SDR family NAD(P)-dependent oxidoreductase [Clostridiales bacterium]|nr:SDR family NAD(P)-dependent oxidoreductase [Clostridiales bacterium]